MGRSATGSTMDDEVYLKSHVRIEPLLCRWPAWSHLIAPAQYAMNVAFKQLPNLRSFVANPAVHVDAARDPRLVGGPFVCLETADVPRARELVEEIMRKCQPMLEFARALKELNNELQKSASGFSLDEFYATLPGSLLGLVELTYDLNQHTVIRLHEELLYGSEIDNTGCQEICLDMVEDDRRPFFMSTPLLENPARFFLRMAFADERIDELVATRTVPRSFREILWRLELEDAKAVHLRDFFTSTPPVKTESKYTGEGVRVRYFGHACVLVQTRDTSILLDPHVAWDREQSKAGLSLADLPDVIDYAVITHAHQDHFVPEMLLALRSRIGQIVIPRNDAGNLADPSLKGVLQHLGYTAIRVVDPFDNIELKDGKLLSLPFVGEHADLNINSKHCVSLTLRGRSLLFLVDSSTVDRVFCRRIAQWVRNVDALFIGMECNGAPLTWLYGPLVGTRVARRADESRRLSGCNYERAWATVEEIGCSQAYVYAMGQEPWLKSLMGLQYEPDSVQLVESNRFVQRCIDSGIQARRLQGCCDLVV